MTTKNLIGIAEFGSYNQRRYGTPWVARFDVTTGRPDFDGARVGGYTGGYNTGDAGTLYVIDPQPGDVYAYGQKDYRGCRQAGSYNIAVIQADGTVSRMTRAEYLSGMVVNA